MNKLGSWVIWAVVAGIIVVVASPTAAHERPPGARQGSKPAPADHGAHQTPKAWKLAWPQGDPGRGREVFLNLECYRCHEVRGQAFPAPDDPEKIGPELSVMGPAHEAEYFLEAIVNPSATLDKGKGYEAADGSSKMPSFNEVLTVQELTDLVAFLKSLRPPAPARAGSASPPQTSGGHNKH